MSYIDFKNIDNPDYPLPIVDGMPDELNREQLFSYAITIFLRTREGKYIVIQQTKPDRVVGDNIVGLGGKIKIQTYLGEFEKVPSELLISSLLGSKLSADDEKEAAARETYEETTEYDENGLILNEGLKLIPTKLQSIGTADIRLCNDKSNDAWFISYYVYDLDGTEGILKPTQVKEGLLVEMTYEELMNSQMFPADRILLQNLNSNIHVEGIYDDIEDIHRLRVVKTTEEKVIKLKIPNYKEPFYYGREYNLGNLFSKPSTFIWMYTSDAALINGPNIELTPFKTGYKKSDPHK